MSVPPPSQRASIGRWAIAGACAGALALATAGCAEGSAAQGSPAAHPAPSASVPPVSATPTPTPTLVPAPAPTPSASIPRSADAVIVEVPEAQWQRMVGVGMWRSGCPMTRAALRRVEVNHFGFDGAVHRGVLVVNADVAESLARVLSRLFDERFPIRQMRPLEDFAGDNEASLAADNTGAYNCRQAAQANAPAEKSPHANGRAIDINPVENPWIDPRCDCWSPEATYGALREGPGVIVEGGSVWTAFTAEGWIWQDIDTPDYMHFDTGYPSRPPR